MKTIPTRTEVTKMPNDDYRISCIDELSGSASAIQIPPSAYEQLRYYFNPVFRQLCDLTTYSSGNSACYLSILTEYQNKIYKDTQRLITDGQDEDSIKRQMKTARRQMAHHMLDEILNDIQLPEINQLP